MNKPSAKIRIWGKVDLVRCELEALKESDGLWLFVDYAESSIRLGTTFTGGTCQLVKIIDQYERVFTEIPQGYKTICKFKFAKDFLPIAINELPILTDWRLTQNAMYFHADD